MNNSKFQLWMSTSRKKIETILDESLDNQKIQSSRLNEAMRYTVLNHGKRIRPLLVIASSQLGNADHLALRQAITAIELIHTYSLIHDDLPAMDNDDLRHGKATCHKAYDEATAILVGDALQTLAFQILSQKNSLPQDQQIQSIQILSQSAGHQGMVAGQMLDIENTEKEITLNELKKMHSLKTGALISCAVSLGILSCQDYNEKSHQSLQNYAKYLGLAFQVVDDILDLESNTNTLGKTAGKDKKDNKSTFASLMSLQDAKKYAQELISKAKEEIHPYQSKGESLIHLADFVINRKY